MRKMRRFKQLLSEAANNEVLRRGTVGIMSIMSDDGYPYGVPLNYYYDEERKCVYMHGARDGMRVDCARLNPKVSFTVVDLNENDPERYSTNFRSVIVFGRARILEDGEEYERALFKFTEKYVKEVHGEEDIKKQIELEKIITLVTAIDAETITGKEAIELVESRER